MFTLVFSYTISHKVPENGKVQNITLLKTKWSYYTKYWHIYQIIMHFQSISCTICSKNFDSLNSQPCPKKLWPSFLWRTLTKKTLIVLTRLNARLGNRVHKQIQRMLVLLRRSKMKAKVTLWYLWKGLTTRFHCVKYECCTIYNLRKYSEKKMTKSNLKLGQRSRSWCGKGLLTRTIWKNKNAFVNTSVNRTLAKKKSWPWIKSRSMWRSYHETIPQGSFMQNMNA